MKELIEKLTVFPNPITNTITITLAAHKDYTTEISLIATASEITCIHQKANKVTGQLVRNRDMPHLPTDMYKLQIRQDKYVEYKSIEKINN